MNENNNPRGKNRELNSTETWYRDQLYKLLAWGGSALIVFGGVLVSVDKNDDIFSLIRIGCDCNKLTIQQLVCSIILVILIPTGIGLWCWGLFTIRNKFSNDESSKSKFPEHSTVLPIYFIKIIVYIISSAAILLTLLAVVD